MKLLIEHPHQTQKPHTTPIQQLQQQQQQQQPNYFLYSQHNVTLYRSPQYNYGIAITGGLDPSQPDQDPAIYVSDVVPNGPAENKLQPNDRLLTVNGVSVESVEHTFAIRLLKEAKEFIHLVIQRRLTDTQTNTESVTKTEEIQPATTLATIRKRCNQAILHTANTLLDNFNSAENDNNYCKSVLKPIKVTLSRKDKREGFGLVLGCKFYIKDIVPESLAANEANLRKGDILVKMNDLGMDQLSLGEANKMLLKNNKLQLSVKRNSLTLDSEASSEFGGSDDVASSCSGPLDTNTKTHTVSQPEETSQPNIATTTATSGEDVVESTGNCYKLSAKQLFKPIVNNENKLNYSKFDKILNTRTIRFARENGIGIRLAGGNKVGIFICDVQYGSPAERAGLKVADKILRVNGQDYSSLTREQAVHHILLLQNHIEMQVALCQADYEAHAFDPMGGDSFHVRVHFNYLSHNPVDLSFKINDILHVTDTLYNGVMGQWVATKLVSNGKNAERGTVPNQSSAEQLVLTADTIDGLVKADSANNNNIGINFHTIGASARMSIRKKLGKAALAKRSKSASRSNANSDTETEPLPSYKEKNGLSNLNTKDQQPQIKVSKANTFAGSKYPAYERVVLKEVNFIRPVVIFGALSDVARDKLRSEAPGRFEVPDSYSSDGPSGGVIKLASIKSIIDSGKHCLLDITPNAVEHLNYAQYFPVCIFLEADSHAHVKEMRAKWVPRGAKPKSAKRLYENASRLEKFYGHLFTSRLSTESNGWIKKLREIIDQQQKMPLWISQELDDLLNSGTDTVQNTTPSVQNYDLALQQHKFLTKQNQIMNTNRYNMFNDNFELPMTSMHGFSTGISGAASTYSLYEDQNYRSSFAASDTDITGLESQPQHQPIYSTNFNNTPGNIGRNSNYMTQVAESTPVNDTQIMHRYTSDSNVTRDNAYPLLNVAKYATYNPNTDSPKNALIQKTSLNYSPPAQETYRPPQLPTQPPKNRNFNNNDNNNNTNNNIKTNNNANYKLIKNSGSSLMSQVQSAIIDTSLHYTDLADQSTTGFAETNETSLVEKLNKLKMGESISSAMSQNSTSRHQNSTINNNNNTNNNNYQQAKQPVQVQESPKRPRKEPPAKPPPPTLPKPKFHLPQSNVTNLVLQRNLKGTKSDLNLSPCPSSSSGLSSATSSIPPGITQQARNKLLEASQGYHSDTWDTFRKMKKDSDTAGSTSDASLNDTDPLPTVKTSTSSSNSSTSCSSSTSSAAAISGATTLSSTSGHSFSAAVHQSMSVPKTLEAIKDSPIHRRQAAVELPIFYQNGNDKTDNSQTIIDTPKNANNYVKSPINNQVTSTDNFNDSYNTDLYTSTNESLKYTRPAASTYTAHYNDNGTYRKLALDSNSNCSIIASANGIFDSNGGILESADTGVSINVPEGAIAQGYSFDLYFKVCHCKSTITNGKGELLTNPIVMCGPRGVKFLKPIELQIPHFISIDGQSWSYAFKTCDLDDSFNFSRFQKKTLINSVTVSIEGF